jgi:Tol biopolymer transport system component
VELGASPRLKLLFLAFGALSAACGGGAVRDGAPNWSPDSSRIVFYSEQGTGKSDLFSMKADGSDRRQITNTPNASEGYPSYSPDGTRILFDSDAANRNYDIWTIEANGFNPVRMTTAPSRELAPAWSPDGTTIAFMSDRDNREFDIYTMNADGTNVQRITNGGTNWFPQFSPDGSRLAFHIGRDVHTLDLATKTLVRATKDPLNGMYPTWSPDGQRIAFMSWRNGATQIYVMKADGSGQTNVAAVPKGSTIDPRWSPDGKSIVFVQTAALSPSSPAPEGAPSAIYVLDVATGKVTRIS